MAETHLNNKRIAKNSIFLFARMGIRLVVSFYTTRVVLQQLGVTDFGIYDVVGGIVYIFSFINAALTIASQRFFSYEIGLSPNGSERLNQLYSNSIIAHFILSLAIVIISLPFGDYIIDYLIIPPDRIEIAKIVFYFSILTCATIVFSTPYTGMIIASERMNIYAYISLAETFIKLGVAFILSVVCYDKLLVYSILMFLVTILVLLAYCIYCKKFIKTISFRLKFNADIIKEFLGFASWSLLLELGWTAMNQGTKVILACFFAPPIIAARGIAYQIQSGIKGFVVSGHSAFNPQIIKSYSSGHLERMRYLVDLGTRIGLYLMLIVTIPIILNLELILDMWLGYYPTEAISFSIVMVIVSIIDVNGWLLETVVKASGKIKRFQIIVSLCFISSIPLSYLLLEVGMDAISAIYVLLLCSIAGYFAKLWIAHDLRLIDSFQHIKKVLYHALYVLILSLPIPLFLTVILNGFYQLFLSCFAYEIVLIPAIYFIGMDINERKILKSYLVNFTKKIKNK